MELRTLCLLSFYQYVNQEIYNNMELLVFLFKLSNNLTDCKLLEEQTGLFL